MGKILVISKKETNILNSIIYKLEQERLEYDVIKEIGNKTDDSITNIIYIAYDDENLNEFITDIPIIILSSHARIIEIDSNIINYIVTPLINDEAKYSPVQKEYLYRKDIYSIINDKILELINNEAELNGLIFDMTYCKSKLKNWVFDFDSINETYEWLSKMNRNNHDFTEKEVNFWSYKIYNDSAKEIAYLRDKIKNIQEKQKLIDVFIGTKSELEMFNKNYFFKLLLKNISETYHMYVIDKDILIEKESFIYNKLLDGVAIYRDCVYIDTYDNEYSLGKVDCKKSTVEEYNKYFDYIIEKYGSKLSRKDDNNGV